ncbi:MAG: hypothetical protein EAX96_09660 [Candidatus Lokiarchaeota archaeon]|nr:hypothetical protein [Candidatus Lokiarchaeota archaeon]
MGKPKPPIGTCPRCSNQLAPKKAKLGKAIECPFCGLKLRIIVKRKYDLQEKKKFSREELGVTDDIYKAYGVTMGFEIEAYSISYLIDEDGLKKDFEIGYDVFYPQENVFEKGEQYTDDVTIGPEFNSPVFFSIKNCLFMLKNSLRKYNVFQEKDDDNKERRIALFGTWLENPAALHVHIGYGLDGIQIGDAAYLAKHIIHHLPFLIALTTSSPIFERQITGIANNRLSTSQFCKSIDLDTIEDGIPIEHFTEINYNNYLAEEREKPPTLEIRVCDTNIPEYAVAALTVIYAVIMRAKKGKKGEQRKMKPLMENSFKNNLIARENAIKDGSKAILMWNDKKTTISKYVDKFFYFYKDELDEMSVSSNITDTFKYLKRGWNMGEIIKRAVEISKKKGDNWEQDFCSKYINALEHSLDGADLTSFAEFLGIKLPDLKKIKLGEFTFFSN